MIIDQKKRTYIFLFFLASMVISLIFGENSSGGSKLDKIITKPYIDNFSISFTNGLDYFLTDGQVHSPLFYYFLSQVKKILSDQIISIIYVFISSIIPLIFYKTLKKKFSNCNKNLLFGLSLLIFLSPYFRSSSVWVTTDNFALLFFILSINRFIYSIYEEKNKDSNIIFSIIFLIFASYIRQHYVLFFIIYFFWILKNQNIKNIFKLSIIFFILSIPGFFYLNLLYENRTNFNQLAPNYLNNFIYFLTILFFYLFPFYLSQTEKINFKILFKENLLIKFIIILLILMANFFYLPFDQSLGGGVIYKLSLILNLNIIVNIVSIMSIFLVFYYFKNFIQFFPLIILFFSYPFIFIYQKYFDPLLLILMLTLVNSNKLTENIKFNNLNLKIIYAYFLSFLIYSNFYYNF
tara:strand:- start:641 stop:1861 length:1221 start_codon:yes stop_codon:yes gene_type:complete